MIDGWSVRFDGEMECAADSREHAVAWCERHCYFASEVGEVLRDGVITARLTALENGQHAWEIPTELGVPSDESATLVTSCLFCPECIETRTGLQGVAEMEAAWWEAVAGGDWGCPKCSESRAEAAGEYT